jgi:rRNA-processing protein FCF1
MNDHVAALVQRYRSYGILVDTNVLLLYFIGSFDRALIGRFKRTEKYSLDDFDLLVWLVSRFDRLVTTPNVLSEVNSLSSQLGEPAKTEYFRHFSAKISFLAETYVVSAEAAQLDQFPKLGLTDSGIVQLVKGKYLIVTDDLRLCGFLAKAGIDALNFNHLRPIF